MTPAQALSVDLFVRQGSFSLRLAWNGALGVLGLFGPSGSGKTTVLEIIAGLRQPAAGRVLLGDRVLVDTTTRTSIPPRSRGVGYAPQDSALFPHMSVRSNVLYGAERAHPAFLSAGLRPSLKLRRTAEAVAEAGPPRVWLESVMSMLEVEHLIDRGVDGLSGGERQRIALARALLSGPSLLLLDEPLSAVDVARRRRILDRLKRWLREIGVPAIHVSHDAAELEGADHVLVLGD